jgi:4-hydroxy 2-oxovalerate aldolase
MNFLQNHSVIDVTLRDAGFLNNWDFSESEVFKVVTGLDRVGIEVIEVGYLSENPDSLLTARCPPSLLAGLKGRLTSASLAGMLRCYEGQIDRILDSRSEFLDLIRIVVSVEDEIPLAISIAEKIKNYGLVCSLNFANFSVYAPDELLLAVRLAAEAKDVFDMFYFADSRGAAHPNEVFSFITAARNEWDGMLGFHAHDMLGMAAANSHAAMAAGCTFIDGSINGYGLGAGNTKLCHALSIVQHFQKGVQKITPYQYKALKPLSQVLDLPVFPEQRYLQYLAGSKNLSGLWVEPLLKHYGDETVTFLQQLPWKRYKRIEDILQPEEVII